MGVPGWGYRLSRVFRVPYGTEWKTKLKGCLRPYHRRSYIPGKGEGFCVVTFCSQSINILHIYNGCLFYGKEDQGDD